MKSDNLKKKTNINKFIKKSKDGNILFKRSKSEKMLFTVVFIIFSLYAFSLVYPLFYLFVNSFQSRLGYIKTLTIDGNAFALPKIWHPENYITAIKGMAITNAWGERIYLPEMFLNSLWYTVITVFCQVLMSSFTGYALAQYKFKIRGFIYGIAIFSLTIPILGSTGAAFKLMSDLRIYNTPWYVIIAALGGLGFNFLIMYGFFKNISWSYAEAVFIDGGGHFTVFFKIMLPIAKAPFFILAIMAFISAWNDYMTVLLYMPDYPTVAAGLYRIQLSFTRQGDMPAYFAGLLLSILPVLILFVVFSDTIMRNYTMGGLKG